MKITKICVLLLTTLTTMLIAQENPFAKPVPHRSRFGMNLTGVNNYGSNNLFVDAMKSARPWRDSRAQGRDGDIEFPLEKDERGYPILKDGQLAVTRLLNNFYPEGTYVMTWQGTADFEMRTPGLRVVSRTPNRIELAGKPSDTAVITLKSSENLSDWRLWLPGMENHPFAFHPDFVETLHCFGTLRYMDLMRTNRSSMTSWENRPKIEDFTYMEKGVPLELLVALANKLDAHPWFCMPERADDEYVLQSARMVSQLLKPTLNAIVEYSNEVGNGSFSIHQYAAEMGRELNLASQEDVELWNAFNAELLAKEGIDFNRPRRPMNLNTMNRHRFQGLRSSQISRLWKGEFMDPTRVKVVVTGSSDQVHVALSHADYSEHIDWISACSYWGHGITSHFEAPLTNLTTDDVFDLMEQDLRTNILLKARKMGLLSRFSKKPLVMYEGGQHLSRYGGGYHRFEGEDLEHMRNIFLQCQRHPRMGELMKLDYDIWFSNEVAMYALFSHISPATGDFAWGLIEYLGQPIDEAPKAKALLEYISLPEIPRN